MDPKQNHNSQLQDADDQEVSEQQEQQIDPKFIQACKKGDYEIAQELLGKQVDVMCQDDRKWTPLMWASNRGHVNIVRLLIKAGACQISNLGGGTGAGGGAAAAGAISMRGNNAQGQAAAPAANAAQLDTSMNPSSGPPVQANTGLDFNQQLSDPFKKPQNAALVGRYTPLHWAAYKGFQPIVWMLLQAGMSPLDIDVHGNNAIHHAAAGGNIAVMECFLSMGIDIGIKNARGHIPLDLATDQKMIGLIKRATETKICASTGQKFDFQNTPYLCLFDKKFYCFDAVKHFWTWETSESLEKQRPVTYSIDNFQKIQKAAYDLQQKMSDNQYYALDKAINDINQNKFDIDPKLKFQATELHRKLYAELDIRNFIKSISYVENYKTIKKSVQILNDKVEKAKNQNIQLDTSVIAEVNKSTSRLIAQRNLRFQMEKCKVSSAETSQVQMLDDLIGKASECQVSGEYTKAAETLSSRMQGNLKSHSILQMFLDYPEREYPEEEVIDPKAAKGAKGKDAGKKTPAKKKRKKEPPFIYPQWAQDLTAVISQVQNLQNLVSNSEELCLDEEFVKQVGEQMGRFKKQIWYRKKLEEEERIAAELKQQKKAAKKK